MVESLQLPQGEFGTILADPPWRYMDGGVGGPTGGGTGFASKNPTPYHYESMRLGDIASMPVATSAASSSHLYLWVPNFLLPDGLKVMASWGFTYKGHLVWVKARKDGQPRIGGMGNYFRNNSELCLFGIKGKTRTLYRNQTNVLLAPARSHSVKPNEIYEITERCSAGPYLELFARRRRTGWTSWGNDPALEEANHG